MSKLTTILLALLFLGCNEKAQSKQPEPQIELPNPFNEDEKIKELYQRKYGEPISDFELSAKSVLIEVIGVDGIEKKNTKPSKDGSIRNEYSRGPLLVTKTATGATARFLKDLDVELSLEEWLDFIRGIYKCRIDKWEKEYINYTPEDSPAIWPGYIHRWKMEIISSDTLKILGMPQVRPANWEEFQKIKNSMLDKIREKLGLKIREARTKLKAEYEKKFGEPISTKPELVTTEVKFRLETKPGNFYHIEITRKSTETNAKARFWQGKDSTNCIETEFSTGEWLDFVRDLYKLRIYEWEKKPLKKCVNPQWELVITHDDFHFHNDFFFNCSNVKPPNWEEFKKVMDDMGAKIKR